MFNQLTIHTEYHGVLGSFRRAHSRGGMGSDLGPSNPTGGRKAQETQSSSILVLHRQHIRAIRTWLLECGDAIRH